VPSIVSTEQLTAGNAIVQTTLHLGMTVGPVLAGLIIAAEVSGLTHQPTDIMSSGMTDYDRYCDGLAYAFLIDGMTFLLSLIFLLFVKTNPLSNDL